MNTNAIDSTPDERGRTSGLPQGRPRVAGLTALEPPTANVDSS